MDKILNTRLKIKIDTEQNWNNNPTFTPLEGELIAYKYDNGIQLKIGDGIKTISQLGFVPGIYYTPSVDSDGVLSWSNNGGLNNPNSITIRGPVGKTPNFSIGTVETSSAQASATITGSAESPILNLSIPKGDTGTVSQEDMAALENIAQGKSKCTVLDDQTALREHFSSNIKNINKLYKKGDIFLLRQVQVPDYWWEPRETETLLQPYYNTEENPNEIEVKDSNGNQIGFLRLLEMSKIDLSDYALKSGLATVATTGNFNDLTVKPTILTRAINGFDGAICAGSDGVAEYGRYCDFHYKKDTTSDYSTRLECTEDHKNNVCLPSSSGTLVIGKEAYKIIIDSRVPTADDKSIITLVV